MAKRRVEPILWLLFSAGGVVAALLIPALLLTFGVAIPLGWVEPPERAYLFTVLSHPLTRLAVVGLCVLALFHWAHRFRYMLYDGLRLKKLSRPITVFCYGGALVGSAAAGYVALVAL